MHACTWKRVDPGTDVGNKTNDKKLSRGIEHSSKKFNAH